ncbi:uncharacterized protein JCM6883_001777 [Sporobolomyces salmoneus]|uniref:uncharacterized protein n=1 Tax=Sporobolomyces salmoneus TaxID=183962 RepID=UPI00316F9D33
MAGSHIDLRKRNQAFQQKAGKINKVKPVDELEPKTTSKWVVVLLLALLGGGIFLELIQQVFNYLTRK